MPQRNPFAVLGLPFDASADAIKVAWRRLARENHPDVTSRDPSVERKATRRMAEINAAYQELRDPEKRRQHREAGIREARRTAEGERGADAGDGAAGHRPYGTGRYGAWADERARDERFGSDWRTREASASHPGWGPRPRPTRPVTGRIDTSAVFHPRNTILHPTERSPLPGLPPRPRSAFERESPRASDPTGPTFRLQGDADDADLPELDEALETRLRFGKFEGRTLGEVAAIEPSYVTWIVRTIGRDPELLAAARVVYRFLERTRTMRREHADSAPPPR